MPLIRKQGLYESRKISFINIDSISQNPMQPRKNFDAKALSELSDSISRYGVLQPITVRRLAYGFELVSGERRLRAAKLAGLSEIPCIVLGIGSVESSLIALVENLQRRDLDFIEEAEGISRLIDLYGLNQEEAARRIGKSQSAIANKLRLLKLSPEILSIIRDANLTERHARALLKLDTEEDRVAVLGSIIKRGLNVSRTEEYIDYYISSKDNPPAKKNGKATYVLKDVRVFLNTVSRGMDIMKQSGIAAQYGRDDTDTDIVLTIKIPKSTA
ncbi:MAG: ParB/RepB/Spo0J family partition protein [Firmicutes bacterium]|nr:ParB/RepB/Spo0J family partition protein [Bacillota bacterium]